MHQEQFRRFARYNRWMNQRLFQLADELKEEERRRDLGAFFRSVHGTLNHLLLVDRLWLGRFRAVWPDAFPLLASASLLTEIDSLGQELFADFQELSGERGATDAVLEAWTGELLPDVLARTFTYTNTRGEVVSLPFWLAVAHLSNHQTHHRGQLTTLFHQLGYDPGITDFLAMAFLPQSA